MANRKFAGVKEEKKGQFLESLSRVGFIGKAVEGNGVSLRTIRNWMSSDEEFRLVVEETKGDAREVQIDNLQWRLYEIGMGREKVDKSQVLAAMFLLNNWAPDKFGEKRSMEHKGVVKIEFVPYGEIKGPILRGCRESSDFPIVDGEIIEKRLPMTVGRSLELLGDASSVNTEG